MPPSNGLSSRARVKGRNDGDSTTAPGWPEQGNRNKPPKYYLRVAWVLQMPCWPGSSNWQVILRVPERLSDPFRRNGCDCIHRLLSSVMKCFARWEHTPWPNVSNG